jgi:hypothetical protein
MMQTGLMTSTSKAKRRATWKKRAIGAGHSTLMLARSDMTWNHSMSSIRLATAGESRKR